MAMNFSVFLANDSELHKSYFVTNDWAEGFIFIIYDYNDILNKFCADNVNVETTCDLLNGKPNSKYIFLNMWNDNMKWDDKENMVSFANYFWMYNSLLFQIFIFTNESKFDVYQFEPFTLTNVTPPMWGDVQLLSDISNVTPVNIMNMNEFPLSFAIFDPTLTAEANLRKTGLEDLTGIDRNLADTLQKHFNYSNNMTIGTGYGDILENGTSTDTIKSIINNQIDMIMVPYFIKSYYTTHLQFGVSVLDDALCVVVPKSERVPIWTLIFYTFDDTVWLLILISIISISLTWIGMAPMLLPNEKSSTVIDRILYALKVFSMFCTISINFHSKYMSERCLIFFALISFLTISGAFQGSLVDVLTKPAYKKNINLLSELAESDIKITTRSVSLAKEVFPVDFPDPVIRKLRQKIIIRNQNSGDSFGQNNIGVLRRLDFDSFLYNKSSISWDGKQLFHYVKECPRIYNLAYVFPQRSIYASRFNNVTQRLMEAGFFTLWRKDKKFNDTIAAKFQIAQLQSKAKTAGQHKFTLEDLGILFGLLSIGNAIGVIVFVIEWKFYRMCFEGSELKTKKDKSNDNIEVYEEPLYPFTL